MRRLIPVGPSLAGVYAIRNVLDSRVYVGSAVLLRRRWVEHRLKLRKGNHHCLYLQRAWDKYGEDAFVFDVLEYCTDIECVPKEQEWMDRLGAGDPERSYNGSTTAASILGMRMRSSTRRKQVLERRGRGKTIRQHLSAVAALRVAGRSGTEAARLPEGRKKNSESNRGEKHWRSKITDRQVEEIRSRRASGESPTTLAKEFGITNGHVVNLCKGRTKR